MLEYHSIFFLAIFLLSPTTAPLSSESPPSYEQLFGVGRMREQVKDARDTSSNKGMFAVKFCQIVCGSGAYVTVYVHLL